MASNKNKGWIPKDDPSYKEGFKIADPKVSKKRKSDKNLKEVEESNPDNGNNIQPLDNEQNQPKAKSKCNLTSSEFSALKERGLQQLDEQIKKGLTDSDNGNNNQHLDDEPKESKPKSKSGLTSSELAILKNVIADGLFERCKEISEESSIMKGEIIMEKGDKVNGPVICNYSDGSKYQGDWNNGKKHGEGILISPDGDRYEGQFENDFPHGEGVYTWGDGVRSEGEFREGKPWSVVGYDEYGEICGLMVDGNFQEVYTDSHRCAKQARYQEEEKETKILTGNRR